MFSYKYNNTVLKEGDILLVHSYFKLKFDVLPAPIIRQVTKCYYNHVAMIGRCADTLFVFEAVGKGFIPTKPLEEWLEEFEKGVREFMVLRPYGEVTTKRINKNIEILIGNGYNFQALGFTFLYYYLTGKWKGKTGEPSKDEKIVCSQAVAYAYKMFFPEWWKISGADIYASKYFKIVYESNTLERKEWFKKKNFVDLR